MSNLFQVLTYIVDPQVATLLKWSKKCAVLHKTKFSYGRECQLLNQSESFKLFCIQIFFRYLSQRGLDKQDSIVIAKCYMH